MLAEGLLSFVLCGHAALYKYGRANCREYRYHNLNNLFPSLFLHTLLISHFSLL